MSEQYHNLNPVKVSEGVDILSPVDQHKHPGDRKRRQAKKAGAGVSRPVPEEAQLPRQGQKDTDTGNGEHVDFRA